MKTSVLALFCSLAMAGVASATNCKVNFKDCSGVDQEVSWTCQNCWPIGAPNFGVCAPHYSRRDPEDPKSCIVTVTPLCSVCVYP
jgi:hypothetical protein